MSGNIYDTNVIDLKKQIVELVEELRHLHNSQESISNWADTLQRKYKDLYRTSNTLFKFIISNYGTPNFNEEFFNQTIDLMLNKISSIQNSQTTQEDASTNVGTHLAYTFIPQLNQK
jgi:hypothetical protein